MKKSALALLFVLCALAPAVAQQPAPPYPGPDAPDWFGTLLAERPNVFEIQQAYTEYYRDRPFVKTTYTQFYKRWMHWARPFVQGDGFLKIPTAEEDAAREEKLREARQTAAARNNSVNWSFAGPNQTYDTDGSTVVTWQTNIYSLDIAPSDPNVLYAGGESGGLWKTLDKGLHWTLLTVNVLHGAFGAVKIHPTDPNTVFAATSGKIIKTTDGGASWTTIHSENNLWVNEFAISPADPNVVLAAADQGLLRTTNGGANWTKLFTNQSWAVKFKVGDATTVFAVRKNGSGSDFMKSTNGGAAFSPSNSGWWTPGSGLSVTGAHIAVCPSNPTKLYTYLCGSGGNLGGYIGVFRSANSGQSWANTNPANSIGQPYSIPGHTNLMDANGVDWFNQGFYDMAIVVNPSNENQLIAGGCSWFKSTDGGATWNGLGGYVGNLPWSHPDIQALAAQGNELWIASDGGLNFSSDFAQTSEARMNGISGADLWGFDAGWNEDILVGGRYHNGNMAWHESMPFGKYFRMGGAESPTGYVNPGPGRKTYFSDIGNYRINGGLTGDVTYFGDSPVYPNESYAYYENSEMEFHPACWNVVFLGYENKLWKSEDGGASYAVHYTFPGAAGNRVYEIEIARSNTSVMYSTQYDGVDDVIRRSADGGQTWTNCTALPLPNNNDRVKMAVSAENANVFWVALTYGSNGKKIYKSADGGQSWQNLTTAILNGYRVTNILAQYGTEGGVYLGTDGGVFYRNNAMSDWQLYSDGLPLSAETNRLKPFYRDGKIRNGCWGFGVWEAPLFETSGVVPQAMCSSLDSRCARDTVYFDDHSAVLHAGASWNWQFPGAAFVSGANSRSPKVLFGQPGEFEAIMTLSTPQGVFADTLLVRVNNDCSADSVPGQALRLGGNVAPGAVSLAPLNVSTNTFSVTAWVKPDGIQPDYSAIFMHDGATAGFNFRPGDNRLGYHWPNGAWWWDSGLTVPAGQWTHVAMVVEPTGITLYVNGIGVKNNFSAEPVDFDSGARLGNYKGWGDRYMKGDMDEVCVYNRSLTQAEIREKMHLRKIPADEVALLAYYQFNEPGGSRVYDRSGTAHGALTGSATRIVSTVAIGPGAVFRKNVVTGKRHGFDGTGMVLLFGPGASLPNGEVVVTRLDLRPDTVPGSPSAALPAYWVLRNFGSTGNFSSPITVELELPDALPADIPPTAYQLWRRVPAGADGASWALQDSADYVLPGNKPLLRFAGSPAVNRSGQYWVAAPGWFAVREVNAPKAAGFRSVEHAATVEIFPNPASEFFTLKTTLSGPVRFRLFDEKGRAMRVERFEGQTTISTAGLAAGAYVFRIENEEFMQFGKVIVE